MLSGNLKMGERVMITKILRGCTVLALAAVCIPARAQTKSSWTFSCPLADDLQTVTAATHGGIPFAIGQGKCSVTGDIAGSASKSDLPPVFGPVIS